MANRPAGVEAVEETAMIHQWERLVYWASQNSAAIQALMAIAIVLVTGVLSAITLYYAVVTRRMAVLMGQQMEAAFQPYVDTAITFRAEGEGYTYGVQHDDTIFAHILVENKG